MVRSSMMDRRLLAGTAIGAAVFGSAAFAQDQASTEDAGIAEVVVTATRQTDTVGRAGAAAPRDPGQLSLLEHDAIRRNRLIA